MVVPSDHSEAVDPALRKGVPASRSPEEPNCRWLLLKDIESEGNSLALPFASL